MPLLKRKETGSLSGKVLAVFENITLELKIVKVKDYEALSKALKLFAPFPLLTDTLEALSFPKNKSDSILFVCLF